MRSHDRYIRLLSAVIFIAAVCVTEAVAVPGPTINVWCVGSPHSRDDLGACLYPLIEHQAQKAGYTIAVENIRAVEFVERFRRAVEENKPPEILMFNNFGILTGGTAPAGHFEGLLQKDPGLARLLIMVYETLTTYKPGGWWTMLVSSAPNYGAARNMALQALPCPVQSGSSRLAPAELTSVSDLAGQVGRAYLVGDHSWLAAVSDEARLGKKTFLPETNVTVEKLQICSFYGNDRLAFVTLAGTFFTTRPLPTPARNFDYARWLTNTPLGQQSLLAVFRRHQNQWRLLAISDDPINTGYSGYGTPPALQRLTGLMAVDNVDVPNSASLITPDGAKVTPPPNVRFGDFEWTPSPDGTVVCEVAEFLVGRTERETTRLFFLFGRERRLSAGMLFGSGGRWRVWSISNSGNVALSESHAYRTH